MSRISAILKKYNDTIDTRKFTRPVGDVYKCHYKVLVIGNEKEPYHYAVVIKEHGKSFEIIPCSSNKLSSKNCYKINLYHSTIPKIGSDYYSFLQLTKHIPVKRERLNDITQCKYKAQVIEDEFEKILAAYTKFISDSQNKAKEKN
jgi:hypothetical protein